MIDVKIFEGLLFTGLVLPAGPGVLLYAMLVSIFVLIRRLRLCLLTTFIFTFYWGFYFNWFIAFENTTNWVSLIGYAIFGLVVIYLVIRSDFSRSPRKTKIDVVGLPEEPRFVRSLD